MLTVDSRTLDLALKLIDEDIAKKTETIQHGHPSAIPDFGIYQRYVGHIMGLMAAKDLIEQAREQANKEAGPRGPVTA